MASCDPRIEERKGRDVKIQWYQVESAGKQPMNSEVTGPTVTLTYKMIDAVVNQRYRRSPVQGGVHVNKASLHNPCQRKTC